MPVPQLLVFRLQAREYALPVETIVEVLRMVAVAPVAHSAPWLSGVINLRGRVVPVIDLRIWLGLAPQPVGLTTPLLMVVSNGLTFGLIVDSATEVLGVAPESIESSDQLIGDRQMLAGIARLGDRLFFILDVVQFMPALFPRLLEAATP